MSLKRSPSSAYQTPRDPFPTSGRPPGSCEVPTARSLQRLFSGGQWARVGPRGVDPSAEVLQPNEPNFASPRALARSAISAVKQICCCVFSASRFNLGLTRHSPSRSLSLFSCTLYFSFLSILFFVHKIKSQLIKNRTFHEC